MQKRKMTIEALKSLGVLIGPLTFVLLLSWFLRIVGIVETVKHS